MEEELASSRKLVISSVVKNTSETKHLASCWKVRKILSCFA